MATVQPRSPFMARQAGMTLIEVMVAMMLVAILLLGMNGLWVTVTQQIDGLVLRQKAIFRLNGEMERLAGLYAAGRPQVLPASEGNGALAREVDDYETGGPVARASYIGTTPDVTDDGHWVSSPAAAGGKRLIYPSLADAPTLTFMVDNAGTSAGAFAEPLAGDMETLTNTSETNSLDNVYKRVLHWDAGVSNSTVDNRNLVWLDRSNGIVAQISWSVVNTKTGTATDYPCYTNASGGITEPCRHITLYLDYPFRYESASAPRQEIPGFPVETITLQTIVSRRP